MIVKWPIKCLGASTATLKFINMTIIKLETKSIILRVSPDCYFLFFYIRTEKIGCGISNEQQLLVSVPKVLLWMFLH